MKFQAVIMLNTIKHFDVKQRWLLASTLLNTALAIAKIVWGLVMGSTLVTADGIHSISDVFGALLIFLALYFSSHRSERFPYGLHKLEDMAALLGGLGIFFAGYEIIHSVFFDQGIQTPESIWSTISFIAIILIVQAMFYFAELKAARRLNSPGVRADAINWLGDIGAGLVVIIGLVAHHYAIPYAQEVAVIIIVIMIFQGAFAVIKESIFSLLDAADIKLEKKVQDMIIAEPGVTQIKRLTIRKSGSVYFTNIELGIAETTVIEAHRKIDKIVDELHKAINELELVTIHYEPDHPPYHTTVELLATDKKTLSLHFGTAPWLHLIKKHPDGRIISNTLIENTAKDAPKGKAFLLAAWLISQHTDTVIMGQADLDENIIALFKSLGMLLKQESQLSHSGLL